MKPEKLSAPVECIDGGVIKIPLYHPDDNNDFDDDDEYDYPLTGPIFKITRNAKRDDATSRGKNNSERKAHKRRRENEEDYSDESDYSDYDEVIPPKIMYGTINTLYKDYIKQIDLEKHPEFAELGKKYLSRALFTIDKTEHKKELKLRRREAKRRK